MANFKFVNLWQTNEERQGKYWLARSCGANSYHAMRQRDWRLAKIERLYGLVETFNPQTQKYTRQLNTAGSVSQALAYEPGIER